MPAVCERRLPGQLWKQESSCSKDRTGVQGRGCWLQLRHGHRAEQGPAGGGWETGLVEHDEGLL